MPRQARIKSKAKTGDGTMSWLNQNRKDTSPSPVFHELIESVRRAKDYISGALLAQLDLGQGSGPMMHNFDLSSSFTKEKKSV